MEEQRQHCALLKLPAELRNIICTDVVCESGGQFRTYENCDTPALLQTCKQIRDEASPIFYAQDFSLLVYNFGRSPPPKFHWLLHNVPAFKVTFQYDYRHSDIAWSEIRSWLKLVHNRKVQVESITNDWNGNAEVVEKLFDVVREMDEKPWKDVKRTIDEAAEWMALAQRDHIHWRE